MKKGFVPVFVCSLVLLGAPPTQAQHYHLNAGALNRTEGAPLFFANGADYAPESDFVYTLHFTNSGRFAGFYQGNITLTALPATPLRGGPDPDAALLGSSIHFRLACLAAPPGGAFGFWADATTTVPSVFLAAGEENTNLWILSENSGEPGADPYGHIHGRRFSATKPGFYKIGITLVDRSRNSSTGGPLHAESAQLAVWFQADVNIQSLLENGSVARLRFAAPVGRTWRLQSRDSFDPAVLWDDVGTAVAGDDHFHEILDSRPVNERRFYRLRGQE